MLPGPLLDVAPGLWVLALTALGAAALGRFYDRVPWPAVGLYAALVTALYGPALYGGRVLLAVDNLRASAPLTGLERADPQGNHLQGDQVLELAPLQAEVRRALRRGEWPTWSALAGAGSPLLANPAAQALQPLVLAALPLPLPRAAGAVAALRVTVALLFAHLLLARLGAGRWAAAAGAVAFALGGHLQLWLGWPRANAAAWLPALLYAVVVSGSRGRRRDLALLAGVAAAVLAGGDRDAAGYALVAAGALAAVRALRRPPALKAKPLLAQMAAVALAFGLAAPVRLPAAKFVPRIPQSFALDGRATIGLRTEVLGFAVLADPERRAEALTAVRQRVVPALAANALGNSRYGRYWGPSNSNEDAAVFAGTLSLLLAGVAAAGWSREAWRRRRRARGSPGSSAVEVESAVAAPSASRAAGRGPIEHEGLFLALAAIVLAVVARPPVVAQLLDQLPYFDPSPVYHQRASVLFVLAVAALAASGLGRLDAAGGGRERLRAVALPAAVLAVAIAGAYLLHAPPDGPRPWGLTGRWLAIQLGALGGGVAAFAAIDGRSRRGLAAVLLIAAELALLHGPANPSLPRRLYYPTPEPIAVLQDAAAHELGARTAALGDALPPLVPAIYGLADPRSRDRAVTLDYHRLVEPLLPAENGEAMRFHRPGHPLWDLLGVRWFLTAPGVDVGPPARLVLDHPTGRVYERPTALPRLFLPARTEVHRAGRPWAPRVAAIDDFRRRALVQWTPRHREPWRATGAEPAAIALTALELARITAESDLGEERLMATSVFQDDGWRLLIDGRRAPTILADGPLVAAWLPPGRHHLELLHRPRPFRRGLLLAALSFALLSTWLGRP